MKPSGVATTKNGKLFIAVRHCWPSSLRSSSAMLRTRAVASAPCGSPPPIDMRPSTGTDAWVNTRAEDSARAWPLPSKWPLTHMPLLCARRKPGCGGPPASMASVMRCAVSRCGPPSQPALQAKAAASRAAIAAMATSGRQGRGRGGGVGGVGSGWDMGRLLWRRRWGVGHPAPRSIPGAGACWRHAWNCFAAGSGSLAAGRLHNRVGVAAQAGGLPRPGNHPPCRASYL